MCPRTSPIVLSIISSKQALLFLSLLNLTRSINYFIEPSSMEQARQPSRYRPTLAVEALDLLLKTGNKLKVLQHLTKAEQRRAADAVEVLKIVQTAPKRKKYKIFLYTLLEHYGPHMVLLCTLALGQAKVVDMKQDERAALMDLIKNCNELDDPILRAIAINHRVPKRVEGMSFIQCQ